MPNTLSPELEQKFPQPFKPGGYTSRWSESEDRSWRESQRDPVSEQRSKDQMMPFFDNGRNQFYPSEAIERMVKSYKTRGEEEVEARIYLKSDPDRGVIVTDYTIDQILRASQPVIPAQPGYRLLTFGFDPTLPGDEPWMSDEPILGWRVDVYGGLEPAVIDYNFTSMTGEHGVLEPTGKVHVIDAAYDDVDSWMRDMKATALKNHEALQARAAKNAEE